MRINKIGFIVIFFFTIILYAGNTKAYAKSSPIATPENVIVTRYSNHALKLTWKKVKNADGYRIYRYSAKKEKYMPVETIKGNKRTSWINKKLGFHKIYRYKISAYQLKKGKKIFSKKSYWVSARTYAGHGRLVNAEDIDLEVGGVDGEKKEINICSQSVITPSIASDDFIKYKYSETKVISKQVRWNSSDESILKVNSKGQITSGTKEGTCYIYARTHNGKTAKVKIKVVDYANPASFPYYKGNSEYITQLLTNFKKEITDIAQYFTVYCGEKDIYGKIKMDEDGNIVGIPEFDTISMVKEQIRKVITEFPLWLTITYSNSSVTYAMDFDTYGVPYIEVTYSENFNFADSSYRIADHWKAQRHVYV